MLLVNPLTSCLYTLLIFHILARHSHAWSPWRITILWTNFKVRGTSPSYNRKLSYIVAHICAPVSDPCELKVVHGYRHPAKQSQAPRNTTSSVMGCSQADFPRFSPEFYEEALKGFDTGCQNPDMKRQVLQLLPSLCNACRLCEIFLEHGEYL